MIALIERLGRRGWGVLERFGCAGVFLFQVLLSSPQGLKLGTEIRRQLYVTGVLSCLIIMISGLFVGMVIGLQGYHTLQKFGAGSQLGQLLALSITRELGPVLSALLFAGRAGSALTAEIGLMKATDQLASLDMMGIDPLRRIVCPRFWAGFVALPLLTLIFSAVAIYGGYLVGVEWLGIDSGSFWSNMQVSVSFRGDVMGGVIKGIVFSFVVVWIAEFQGIYCTPTAEGISDATTKTVVCSSLAVLGLDFILTSIMIGDWS